MPKNSKMRCDHKNMPLEKCNDGQTDDDGMHYQYLFVSMGREQNRLSDAQQARFAEAVRKAYHDILHSPKLPALQRGLPWVRIWE